MTRKLLVSVFDNDTGKRTTPPGFPKELGNLATDAAIETARRIVSESLEGPIRAVNVTTDGNISVVVWKNKPESRGKQPGWVYKKPPSGV